MIQWLFGGLKRLFLGKYVRHCIFVLQYSLHITLVDQCLKLYRDGINEVCKVEQNLATGADAQGEPITDPMKDMMPCLFNRKIGYVRRERGVEGREREREEINSW